MVTARQRPGPDVATLVDRIGAAARAGVHLIQIRQPDFEALPLTRLVADAVHAVAGTPARVIVNDRLDVALAAGAHGLHLRADSFSAVRARAAVPPGFLIGRSVHSVDEVDRAGDAAAVDYLICGTIFGTASKPGVRPAGLGVLSAVCAKAAVPVLAIGGIQETRLPSVAHAGAAGFAAIGLFAEPPVERLSSTVRIAAQAFAETFARGGNESAAVRGFRE
jgi:thiamine-phosphate pyrophosphorylase